MTPEGAFTMNILNWLKDRWQHAAEHYTYYWIDGKNVRLPGDKPFTETQLEAGNHYFRLWLVDMFLSNDREWGSAWHPAVYSAVRFQFGNQEEQISHVAGQSMIKDIDLAGANHNVTMNYQVTPLVPFNGGTVELETGLLAMQGKNDVRALLGVLGSFSKLLVVPQLSAALSIAGPLADGISQLIGISDARPTLRFHDAWTGGGANPLRSGYFVVLADEPDARKSEKFSVRDNGVYYDGRRLSGVHYMLFRIDGLETRDDWEHLASIQQPFEEAISKLQESIAEPDPEVQKKIVAEAERRLGAALLAAFRARELSRVVGRNQVVAALKQRFQQAKAQLGAGAFPSETPGSLADAMRNPMPPEEAMALGEIAERDLYL